MLEVTFLKKKNYLVSRLEYFRKIQIRSIEDSFLVNVDFYDSFLSFNDILDDIF